MDNIFLNILFAVISLFIFLLTVGLVFLVVYMIFILKSIKNFVDVLQKEAERVMSDIEKLREMSKSNGAKIASFAVSAFNSFKNRKKNKKQ